MAEPRAQSWFNVSLRSAAERNVNHAHRRRIEAESDGQPLSLSSQSHSLTALRSWFTWLVRQGKES